MAMFNNQWAQFDEEDSFDDENFSEESSEEFDEELNDMVDKRDPAHTRKRQLSGAVSPLGRPKLKRIMSNNEKGMCHLGDFHVNDNKLVAVDMATPGNPDHTYSAVGFNIHGQPTGHVIRIKGFSIGGMLNRIRIYMAKNVQCHAIRDDIHAWDKIYDAQHEEAWRSNYDVMLEEPVIIPPCDNVAFYVHSDRQDDLGLKYRSCNGTKSIVHKDRHILITRGFAHTSPVPFNQHQGWYRENRVLSGNVYYDAIPIRWTNYSHDCFPEQFQAAIILLRHCLVECQDWHEHVVDNIIEFFPYDWFGQEITSEEFMEQVAKRMRCAPRSAYGDFW